MYTRLTIPTAPMLAGAVLVVLTSCSAGEVETRRAASAKAPAVIDIGPYAIENAALDQAVDRTGLPREASIWVQRTADGNVVCGALARPSGRPVLYLSGGLEGGYLGLPLARLSPEIGERVLDQANRAVLTNCADHGLVPPERVQVLLRSGD